VWKSLKPIISYAEKVKESSTSVMGPFNLDFSQYQAKGNSEC